LPWFLEEKRWESTRFPYPIANAHFYCLRQRLGGRFARDGKSFLYDIASRSEVTIYRQSWKDGRLIGQPLVALRLPFAYAQSYDTNASDFSLDLSTIVYARPGGNADLYLLSQK
jgi:hypothetical protein